MLAQGMSSSAKGGGLVADVSSRLIFLKKNQISIKLGYEDLCLSDSHIGDQPHLPKPETIGYSHAWGQPHSAVILRELTTALQAGGLQQLLAPEPSSQPHWGPIHLTEKLQQECGIIPFSQLGWGSPCPIK